MKQLLIEIDEDMATQLERVAQRYLARLRTVVVEPLPK